MIVIVGDSHTDAIKRAVADRTEVKAYRIAKEKNGSIIGDLTTEQIETLAKSLNSSDLIVSTIGGNQHAVFSLVQHEKPFDFVEPDCDQQLPGESTLIPYNVLYEYLDRGVRNNDGKRLTWLKKIAPCPVIHLMPPPPKEDEAHILRKFESNFAAAGIVEKGITPAPIRLKVWRIQANILKKLCDELSVSLMMPPSEALENGYLAPRYYANDATHANQAYGELVVSRLK